MRDQGRCDRSGRSSARFRWGCCSSARCPRARRSPAWFRSSSCTAGRGRRRSTRRRRGASRATAIPQTLRAGVRVRLVVRDEHVRAGDRSGSTSSSTTSARSSASTVCTSSDTRSARPCRTATSRSPTRAAKIAKYIGIDGASNTSTCGSPTAGLDCIGIWQGTNMTGNVGDNNVRLSPQTHVQVATSAESFAAQYEFFTGAAPATTLVLPEPPGRVRISGRAVAVSAERRAGRGDAGDLGGERRDRAPQGGRHRSPCSRSRPTAAGGRSPSTDSRTTSSSWSATGSSTTTSTSSRCCAATGSCA